LQLNNFEVITWFPKNIAVYNTLRYLALTNIAVLKTKLSLKVCFFEVYIGKRGLALFFVKLRNDKNYSIA
jgi:hypothetical protein